ncbi:MAG TPA: hypothetical protein PLZ45_07020 [Ferruginibacter sp.]|nr:hypothetical protein [Chitinophagaceae bacterium]HRI24411.1 hypothetical protein [Ferruginibacter sp.]
MKAIKNTTCLLLIALFITGTANAQVSPNGSKITITNFTVYEKNDQLVIDWQTDGLVEANYWQIQRSEDGKNFRTIALVLGPDPRQGANRYQYKGKMRKRGESALSYRLSPVDRSEQEINTEIIPATK